jgi:hypothetical protein
VARRLAQAVAECGRPVVAFGAGWHSWTDSPITIARLVSPSREPRGWRPLVALLPICADPFALAVQAAGLGWPLLVHAPGGDSPDAAFGGALCSNRDFGTFRGARDLARQVSELCRDSSAADSRAARTAARIREEHSWSARAKELIRGIRS